jgi:hypothetical protein
MNNSLHQYHSRIDREYVDSILLSRGRENEIIDPKDPIYNAVLHQNIDIVSISVSGKKTITLLDRGKVPVSRHHFHRPT